MKVLIIDDSKAMRMFVSEWIVAMGHEVVHAETGREGLEFVRENDVDLVMMDIEMPGMNGFETTRAIRALEHKDWFPIIFLTAKTDDESFAEGIEAGGDAYLSKPVSPLRCKMQIVAMERIHLMRQKLQQVKKDLLAANQALKHTTMHDQLTGLSNRRFFDITLPREFELARRDNECLSLIMCDIDYFKSYNDIYGHVAGDTCLKHVARAIASFSNRPTDLACRYGGEEFAVILPRTGREGGLLVAEKIREALAAKMIPHRGSEVSTWVTLSQGLATYRGQFDSFDELTEAADNALYLSKERGRNRVECG
ncbi:MAG: GGDEF domain-containing response regulator [Gammaproteobacteria bacterium]